MLQYIWNIQSDFAHTHFLFTVSQSDMDCSESEGDSDQCQGGLQTKGIKHCV